jgi:hypothetical protein
MRGKSVLVAAIALSACSTPLDPYVAGNNQATISGPALGTGLALVDSLRKKINVTMLPGSTSDITVQEAYLTRNNLGASSNTYIFIKVKNASAQAYDQVALQNLTYKDSSGNVIDAESIVGLAEGSVCTDDGIASYAWQTGCLGPGEVGYYIDQIYKTNGWDTASVEFTTGVSSRPVGGVHASLIPKQYAVAQDGTVTVTYSNQGTVAATVGGLALSKYVLLDDMGLPLIWGFLGDNLMPTGMIAPGSSGAESDKYGTKNFDGSSKSMLVFMAFDKQ